MKKKKSKSWVIALLVVLLLGTLGGSYYLITTEKEKTAEAEAAKEAAEGYIDSNTVYLYVTTTDVHKGDILTEGENVQIEECLTALPETMYITEEQLGSIAVVDIDYGTPVFINMITPEKITKDLREVEVAVAQLPLNIDYNNYVDLRIRFASGQDFIIASKLRIKDFDLDNSIFYTDLNESEILILASATVDAYTNTGTKIYLATYEEPNLQEEAMPNYPVKEEVYNLILQDPNIINVAEGALNLEARNTLRSYLGLLSEEFLESVSEGDGLADTAHSSAMSAKAAEYYDEYEYYDTYGGEY